MMHCMEQQVELEKQQEAYVTRYYLMVSCSTYFDQIMVICGLSIIFFYAEFILKL